MGAVLGSGILILPGYTAEVAGPASILSWLLLSLLSIPVAYTFARLALRFAHFGGLATMIRHAFGPVWGAVAGWWFIVWVGTGQTVVGLTGAAYVTHAFGLPSGWSFGIAFLFLLAALLSNFGGMRVSGGVSLLLSGAVLLLLVATIALALPRLEPSAFTPFAPHGAAGAGRACVLIFWAFFGWESITHLVPEFRNPQRDVLRSTWASVFLIGAVYTLLAVVTIGTHTYGSGAGTDAPLAALMSRTIGFSAAAATAAVACIVCLGTLNVYVASISRLGHALAAEGQLPRWLGGVNRRGFPYRTGLFLFATNAVELLLSYWRSLGADKLILLPTTLGICLYVLASLACVKLLWHDKAGRWSALLAALCCLLIAPFAREFLLAPLLVGLACWLYLRWRRGRERRTGRSGS
ncbi:amino acid permease [Paenibacillus athensensis]|uniref:Amino acid permease n=2 Tax=Paenibacillus athensensis TaxID=1967502 RepID=A0A4Y8PYX0_9BACL|nr:amino acid permease [Paenibacillus athensensis]